MRRSSLLLAVIAVGAITFGCSKIPPITTNAASTSLAPPSLAPTPQTVTDTASQSLLHKVMVTRTLPGGQVTSYATTVLTHTASEPAATKTKTETATKTATQTQTSTETVTQTQTQTQTQTVTETVTETVTDSPSA